MRRHVHHTMYISYSCFDTFYVPGKRPNLPFLELKRFMHDLAAEGLSQLCRIKRTVQLGHIGRLPLHSLRTAAKT